MLVHRENSLLPSSGGDPSFGAAYSVTAYPVGARASQASSGSTATTDAGHSFRVGDKALIRPGSDNLFTAAITAVTSTTIAWGAESYSVYAGDQIVNMGPDTGTTSPNYNGSPMAIYRDGDGTTQETYATVTSSSVGEYAYWHKGDGRFWELLRDGDGTVTGVVAGFGGVQDRVNICDYGAAVDRTADDSARIQAAIDAIDAHNNGTVYFPSGVCSIYTAIEITSEIRLVGAGKSQSFLEANTSGMTMVKQKDPGTRCYRAGIFDMNFLGNSLASIGLDLADCSLCDFERINFSSMTTGIKISSPTAITSVYNYFTDVIVLSCTTGYLIAYGGCNENHFINCRAGNCSSRGFDIQNGSHNLLFGCSIESNATGVHAESVGGGVVVWLQVLNCRFENNTGTALNLVGSDVRLSYVSGGYWSGNGTNYADTADRTFMQVIGQTTYPEKSVTPPDPPDGEQVRLYMRDDKIILQYNDGGTVRYKYMDLDVAGAVWLHKASDPNGDAPITMPSAYTQTYSTADKTHADPTAATLTDSSGGTPDQTVAAVSGSGADADINNNFAECADEINKLVADLADAKQLLNSVIDDLQTLGLLQ